MYFKRRLCLLRKTNLNKSVTVHARRKNKDVFILCFIRNNAAKKTEAFLAMTI